MNAILPALLLLAATPQDETAPLRLSGDEVRPGLVAVYSDAHGETLHRIDDRPAFTIGTSSPHPRLAPGPFEVRWEGIVQILDDDEITFGVEGGGDVELSVGGVDVLKNRLRKKPGLYRFRAGYKSVEGKPARLRIWWEGKAFTREPLPAFRLFHRRTDRPKLASDGDRELGRMQVERLGCARCHSSALPGVSSYAAGPSLENFGDRSNREWLLRWLENPRHLKEDARMPRLFSEGRRGFVERWAVSEYLLSETSGAPKEAEGDHRMGKRTFLTIGCVACHYVPDMDLEEQDELGQIQFIGLEDRTTPHSLVEYLKDPLRRYPDGRMPKLPLSDRQARDVAAYLFLWSKSTLKDAEKSAAPAPEELKAIADELNVEGTRELGRALMAKKNCLACHTGLEASKPVSIPFTGRKESCISGEGLPRFTVTEEERKDVVAYLEVAEKENHASPFETRRRLIDHLKCFRCHTADRRRPVLEEISSQIGGAYLQYVPFMRTPRLANPLSKYRREYLAAALRNGVKGVRHGRYSWKMPHFGDRADEILRALAEADGEDPDAPEPAVPEAEDPTLFTAGPELVGFGGYACVSCHVWKGKRLSDADPGHIGPEMTTVAGRIRKEWFDRWLEDPARMHPGTPMPQIFPKGKPAKVRAILDGDAAKQRDALWAFLLKGKDAPSPKPRPPIPLRAEKEPLVSQIPIRLPDNTVVESICVLYPSHDLLIYDMGQRMLAAAYTGAQLLRRTEGRRRTYTVSGTPVKGIRDAPLEGEFAGYDRLSDGVRIRTGSGERTYRLAGRAVAIGARRVELPAAKNPEEIVKIAPLEEDEVEGSLVRPGYRAIAYPRPKTVTGEDLIMPGAIAAHPRDGRVFVASMKQGEIFVIEDPNGDGKGARFVNYAGGLFQEAYSMLCDSDALYVLHRRNLTAVSDGDGDGKADRFDRIRALPQQVADGYDYGYGLTRDKSGAFVWSHAPHANRKITGSGGSIRLVDGKLEELSYGFRNPIGWCVGPDREIFFTDNQGEWVATNKLCHMVKGRYYGYPNREQKQHTTKPFGRTTIWVPYAWAQSINGVTYADTGGKFGPFDNQIYMAELMYGGAIIRASLETVNGEMQGACFPFWKRGLLGPLVLAFDPKGRLWVGSITEPGWMAQPDRGAVYRIDFTGEVPFEMETIRVRPDGFRIVFTKPVDPATARRASSYDLNQHRYEYTGAYGSPELDRTAVAVKKLVLSEDGKSVEVTTDPLVAGRVYMISAEGVRSKNGRKLVHPQGAYTLNEIPGK